MAFALALQFALFWPAAVHAGAALYAGGYNGIGPASGMAMVLEQDQDKIYGRIVDGQSNVFQVNGQVSGSAVKGTLYNERAQATFTLELRPSGVNFVFIPSMPDGRPIASAQKNYTFARGRVAHPALANYRVAAPKDGDKVDVILFLENYRSWSFEEVATGYAGVSEGDRAVFRLFDHLHADLMLRLCRAEADQALIADIAQGQPIGCDALMELAGRAEAYGVMRDFYDVTEFQRGSAYTAFACDRALYPPSRCLNVDKLISHAASHWRSSKAIFTELTESSKSVAALLGIDDDGKPVPSPVGRPAETGVGPSTLSDGGRVAMAQRQSSDEEGVTQDKALMEATKDIQLQVADVPDPSDKPSADPVSTVPAEVALAARLKRPRPRPASIALQAESERRQEASEAEEKDLFAIRPTPRPNLIASDQELASVQQSEVESETAEEGALSAQEEPSDLRPTVSPTFDGGFAKRPRPKPARFVPELVPHPRARPTGSG